MLPNDLPPRHVVHQQTQLRIRAGVFERIVHDLRTILRLLEREGLSRPPIKIYGNPQRPSPPVVRCG